MEKPLSLVIKESKQTIIDAINSVNLHPTLLEMVVKDIYIEVQALNKSVCENELKEYQERNGEKQ